ncbi:MAG TPA: glycine betaine/L-proline ABC transporter ATP-binding protein [Acidimicrobiia bacterium]|nr:glycine betaine/L-proline ABC transporter ATP-binding protein [Acidimicrobiia bacterium]
MQTKIKLTNVVKIFGQNPRGRPLEMLKDGASIGEVRQETGHVVGVADISADIAEGEVFVVMGLSGSGKSTLIRCINRIHEPTDGAVFVDGENIVEVDMEQMRQVRRKKMAMVFQHFALFPHKRVIDNAGYGLKVQGIDEQERRDRAMDALNLVGLGDWAQRYPHNLSGGMQQRVGLARALATDPDILLMDEAFSALDPLIRRQMQNELLSLQERVQKTIVFITHDLNEALRIGSRVMIMKEGRAVQVGTPTQIVTEPEDEYVSDFMADVDHAKVLPAGFVMKEAPTLSPGLPASEAAAVIGSKEAGYVVDAEGKPLGVVTPDLLAGAVGSIGSIVGNDFPKAPVSTSLASLFRLSSGGKPVAVLDGAGRLVGMVSPLDILTVLGRVEVVDDPRKEVKA